MKRSFRFFPTRKSTPSESGTVTSRYRYFRSLLRHNHRALSLIAEMEQLYYSGRPFTLNHIRILYEELLESVTGLAYCLEVMTGLEYPDLTDRIDQIDKRLFDRFMPVCTLPATALTIKMEDIVPEMKRLVGSKALNLSIVKNLLGIEVPAFFVVTSYAFERFIEHNRLNAFIEGQLSGLGVDDHEAIESASKKIRERILHAQLPDDTIQAIWDGYTDLEKQTTSDVMTAVRSSAVGEDTEATFAGQYDTVLNVRGTDILDAYKTVIASKYAPRSINYRMLYGLDDKDTPMAVMVIAMIRSKASGVLYTVDPAVRPHCPLKITSIYGIGEQLVSGVSLSDVFLLDRLEEKVLETRLASKKSRMVASEHGGSTIEEVDEESRFKPSIDRDMLLRLRAIGLMFEEYFEAAQDIEWAIDEKDCLYILQTRPLNVPKMHPEDIPIDREIPGAIILLSGGETASSGIAAGMTFHLKDIWDLNHAEGDIIVVAKNASPDIARFIGKIKGLITESGSAASHMASVAREFGVPALFGVKDALSLLPNGQPVTLWAEMARVYDGIVEDLLKNMNPSKKMIYKSSVFRRMREVLDLISPLTLTDAKSPEFVPSKTVTFHDIIRYTHEMSVRTMFGISSLKSESNVSASRLKTKLPLNVWIIDMASKGRKGSDLKIEDIASVPFNALWRGFTHPGVNWQGTMSIDTSRLSAIIASVATSELGEMPGGDSYAVISEDYMNLSIRFAYHFATIDALCGENSSQNYISLQFSGGAGSYYGKALRIELIGAVLKRLGFAVDIKGDLIEALYQRHDRVSTETALDMMGRLLASSRLLDMTISNQQDIDIYTEEFFSGNYDFINLKKEGELRSFYIKGGLWKVISDEGGKNCLLHDISPTGKGAVKTLSNLFARLVGKRQNEFVDTIETHYYFPMAILKGIEVEDCRIALRVKLLSGKIDKSAGIAFGIRNVDNYYIFGPESNEGCLSLYEFVHGRRFLRQRANKKMDIGLWHTLSVKVNEREIRCLLNDTDMMQHTAEDAVKGSIGIWAKGDSVVLFDALHIETLFQTRDVVF